MKFYQKNPAAFMAGLRKLHIADSLHLQIPGGVVSRLKDTHDKDWSKISLPFISIGYETKLTPLQLLTFYNAVANNGKMVEPLLVKEIRNKGRLVKQFPTHVIADSICSHSTILKAKSLLEEVVNTGTASAIKHAQYTIAGKTGTAQIAQGSGGYNKSSYQASFVGYFPADKPKYSCIVVVYAPGNQLIYGASVACPVFKEISDKVYSLNVEMHDELKQMPDSVFAGLPKMKAGLANPATLSRTKLALPNSGIKNGWLDENQAVMTPPVDAVPNVVGMGLRDAIYLLESEGLMVKPVGFGTVLHQSMKPGQPILKGQQIVIELG
jgi:cell division protein FtsI (penicillin-binding protein 3)